MRADGYVRVSRVGGRAGDSFISPELQREQIERWAAAHDVELLEIHVDLDESGGKSDRPGFQRMLDRVEQGLTDGVVVAKLDRFARSLPGALEAIRRIDASGATFTSVAEGIDPTTPAGKMMHRLMLILAEFELDRITEGWAAAQERAVSRGVHLAVPFGYRREQRGLPLEADPDTSELVREVFQRKAQGASWSVLAAFLNERCLSPTGHLWTGRTVRHLIDNPVYLGEAYHGRFRRVGAHEAIVSRAEWEAAQGVPGLRPAVNDDALLTGLIRCAGCRYRMKGDRGGRPRVRIYRCRGSHGAGVCPAPASVTAEIAEEFVVEQFLRRYGKVRVRGARSTKPIEQTQARLADAEAELEAFAGEIRLREALGHERFVAQVEIRAKAVDSARATFEQARGQLGDLALEIKPHDWHSFVSAEKRQLLRAGIGAVFLRRTGNAPISERACIVWPTETPDDLPGPGRLVPIRSFDFPSDLREAAP